MNRRIFTRINRDPTFIVRKKSENRKKGENFNIVCLNDEQFVTYKLLVLAVLNVFDCIVLFISFRYIL